MLTTYSQCSYIGYIDGYIDSVSARGRAYFHFLILKAYFHIDHQVLIFFIQGKAYILQASQVHISPAFFVTVSQPIRPFVKYSACLATLFPVVHPPILALGGVQLPLPDPQ